MFRRLMSCQSVRRFIDTNNPRLGRLCRQNGRAHAGAAEGVEHDGSRILAIGLQELRESFPCMGWAGFLPGVLLVMPHDIRQVGMGFDLIGLQHCLMRSGRGCLRSSSHLAIIPRICRPTESS